MNALPLVWKTMRDLRAATLAIGATTFLMAVLVVALFPSYSEQFAEVEYPSFYDAFVGEAPFSSPEGFASAEFFSWIPLLLIVLATIGGTATVAGEESAGTADALFALPVKRRDVFLAKALGNGLALVVVALVAYPGFAVTSLFFEFPIDWVNLWFAVLAMLPVSFVFLAIALWGSAGLPGRGAATIATIAAVVVAYVVNTLGSVVSDIEVLRKLSPFYWSDGAQGLVNGVQPWRASLALAVALAVVLASLHAVERREIGVHKGGRVRIPGWGGKQTDVAATTDVEPASGR